MALIVLDTDVVSHHRAGRLPAGFARQMVSNDISIAFATAAELLTLNRRDFADSPSTTGWCCSAPERARERGPT